jgi:hypothetical protein
MGRRLGEIGGGQRAMAVRRLRLGLDTGGAGRLEDGVRGGCKMAA